MLSKEEIDKEMKECWVIIDEVMEWLLNKKNVSPTGLLTITSTLFGRAIDLVGKFDKENININELKDDIKNLATKYLSKVHTRDIEEVCNGDTTPIIH